MKQFRFLFALSVHPIPPLLRASTRVCIYLYPAAPAQQLAMVAHLLSDVQGVLLISMLVVKNLPPPIFFPTSNWCSLVLRD